MNIRDESSVKEICSQIKKSERHLLKEEKKALIRQ